MMWKKLTKEPSTMLKNALPRPVPRNLSNRDIVPLVIICGVTLTLIMEMIPTMETRKLPNGNVKVTNLQKREIFNTTIEWRRLMVFIDAFFAMINLNAELRSQYSLKEKTLNYKTEDIH